MSNSRYQSWGRYPRVAQKATEITWRHEQLPLSNFKSSTTMLPFGNGRSYGDSCMNSEGLLVDARPLNRFINFDERSGLLDCEAGTLLSEILELVVPKGWFLPVTPGTQYVTVGGAIANDVHGKNHHCAGTFGCHIKSFELLRSDGSRINCSPWENKEFFSATISGLGLTGLITQAQIQLKPVSNSYIEQEIIRYQNLDEFFQITEDSDQDYEYTVAWIDCLATGNKLGRGLFTRGNHAPESYPEQMKYKNGKLAVPFEPPISLINGLSLKAFNHFYYHKKINHRMKTFIHYQPFMYPLDSISNWNRLYGPKGFLQYQCVVSTENGRQSIHEILNRIARAGIGSFLAVLKEFGSKESPGMMSFPRPGITLALDFPIKGKKVFTLLDELDTIVADSNGAVYPAKDARMSGEHFRSFYPEWKNFKKYIDPYFSSNFWRRVQGNQV